MIGCASSRSGLLLASTGLRLARCGTVGVPSGVSKASAIAACANSQAQKIPLNTTRHALPCVKLPPAGSNFTPRTTPTYTHSLAPIRSSTPVSYWFVQRCLHTQHTEHAITNALHTHRYEARTSIMLCASGLWKGCVAIPFPQTYSGELGWIPTSTHYRRLSRGSAPTTSFRGRFMATNSHGPHSHSHMHTTSTRAFSTNHLYHHHLLGCLHACLLACRPACRPAFFALTVGWQSVA